MRFAIITDIHLGLRDNYWEKYPSDEYIKNLLDKFVEEVKNDKNIDFIVMLWDFIEDIEEKVDKENINYIISTLNKSNKPVF